MSRQSLIDRWGGGTCPNMFKGGTSPLFIVKVSTFKLNNGWVIAILVRFCQISHPPMQECCQITSSCPRIYDSSLFTGKSVAKWRQGPKVTLAQNTPLSYYYYFLWFLFWYLLIIFKIKHFVYYLNIFTWQYHVKIS